jgi:hypothetical protein
VARSLTQGLVREKLFDSHPMAFQHGGFTSGTEVRHFFQSNKISLRNQHRVHLFARLQAPLAWYRRLIRNHNVFQIFFLSIAYNEL